MTTQYLTIEHRQRQMPGELASLADFTVTAGDTVNADIVRSSPNISLYCLDDAAKRAIFVELAPEVDLSKAPFVYLTQYELAQRLISMPYDSFTQLAHELPKVDHLIMIYMTGRCGSTLLSHVLNQLDSVLSLSEPDVATHFVHLRRADGSRDAELRELLDCTVRVLCKPTAFKTSSVFALKLRNEGTQVMDLYQATFPQVKNLFLYRDAIGWVTSFYRIYTRFNHPALIPLDVFLTAYGQLFNYDFTQLASYLDAGSTEISTVQLLTLWWLAAMEWYLAQHAAGMPILAARYSDLNAQHEQVLSALFTYCGLPAAKVNETLGVFARDSQAGTDLAREKPEAGNSLRLSNAQCAEITSILKRHPTIKQPDFIAPGTLRV